MYKLILVQLISLANCKWNASNVPTEITTLTNEAKDITHCLTVFRINGINGFCFHTRGRELNWKCQNSGVMVTTTTTLYHGCCSGGPTVIENDYVDVLEEITELD